MTDDSWADNVGPLITALEALGLDPVDWAKEPDTRPFRDGEGLKSTLATLEDVHFGMGYLQATGNLTGRTWVEQLEDHRKQWK